MSVTVVSGQNMTSNVLSGRIVVPMDKTIALLEPSETPLLTILQRIKKVNINHYRTVWLEKAPLPWYIQTDAAIDASGAGTITITDFAFLRANDVLINDRTNEVLLITATPTTSTVAVVRGAGTTHAAVLAADKWYRASSAEGEGTGSPDSRGVEETEHSNLVQIIKEPIEGSATLEKTDLHGGPQRPGEQKWAGMEHKKKYERAVCFGELRDSTDANSKPLRMMRGLFSDAGFVATKRYDMSAGYTEADFDMNITDAFEYGSDTKVGFAGKTAMLGINAFARDKLRVIHPSKDKGKLNYGITVAVWNNGYGTLQLIPAKQWKGDNKARMLGILDLKNVELRHQFPTVLEKDIQAPDLHGYKDQWLTGGTVVCKNEETCALFTGM